MIKKFHIFKYVPLALICICSLVRCKQSNEPIKILIPANADITELYDTLSLNRPAKVPNKLLPGMTVEVLSVTSDEIICVFMPIEDLQLSTSRAKTVFRDLFSPDIGELFIASAGSKIIVPERATRLFFETVYSEQDMDTVEVSLIPFDGNSTQYKSDSCLPAKTSFVQLEGDRFKEVKPSQLNYGNTVYVEVLYSHVPSDDELEISLSWDLDQSRLVSVFRTDEDPSFFRSEPFLISKIE